MSSSSGSTGVSRGFRYTQIVLAHRDDGVATMTARVEHPAHAGPSKGAERS